MPEEPALCIMAVDPGLTGAIAFFFPSAPERVSVEDMPVADGEVDVACLARRIAQFAPAFAFVEQVGPMPHDGCRQAFGFGGAYHAVLATVRLSQVPMHRATPQTWKKHHRLPGGDAGKEAGRALALRLFPASADRFERKKDHGRAEAALMAKFAADTIKA